MIKTIAVIGAGTMGSGIAQVAAQSGHSTILFDLNEDILQKAKTGIEKNLEFLVGKQKITSVEKETIVNSIRFISNISECTADIIIEAIVENVDIKKEVFNQLASVNSNQTIFATNTSSLSVTEIQSGIIEPQRVAGMHFFNPAPIMKLVEVVKGAQTADDVVQTIFALCKKMGKTPVICKDAPGFIVNRVARHYYLEAMKLVETGIATFENVDAVMEASGFKMGPFKLMDLIGMDVNLAVSTSMYNAFNQEERFTPSPVQINKVAAGELGRKTGKGFYTYQ